MGGAHQTAPTAPETQPAHSWSMGREGRGTWQFPTTLTYYLEMGQIRTNGRKDNLSWLERGKVFLLCVSDFEPVTGDSDTNFLMLRV